MVTMLLLNLMGTVIQQKICSAYIPALKIHICLQQSAKFSNGVISATNSTQNAP